MMQPTLGALLLACMAGCGPSATVEPVSGVVTLDGKPLGGAVVRFSPAPQADPQAVKMMAIGETDDQGRYSMQVYDGPTGAVVGVNRVTISTARSLDSDAEEGGMSPELVPSEYNSRSKLEFEVPAGGTDSANFELRS